MKSPSLFSIGKSLSLTALLVVGVVRASAQSDQATNLLSFDDLITTNVGVHVPANYGGLAWAFSAWYYMPSIGGTTNTYLALGGTSTAVFMPGGQDFYFDGADYDAR
jgi:hypothetical protein